MLSSIRSFWPPAPSPDQPETGWKMLTHRGADAWSETLVGLHTPAWWTGLRLVAAGGWNTVYRVKLRKIGNQPGFPYIPNECEWTQVSGDWHPLPYALPAKMATLMGLELVITPTGNAPADLITSLKISFQEMPQLNEKDRYLFCDDEGRLVHMWNGRHQSWGSPDEGEQPLWRQLHTVVPTMKWLMHMPWNDRPFCIHDWKERAPMRDDQQA